MSNQNSKLPNKQSKWIDLLFVFMMVGVYFLYAAIWDNYFEALIMPVIIGFIWFGLWKQKVTIAVGVAAIFIVIAWWLVGVGYMRPHILTILIALLVLLLLSYGVTVSSWGKSIAMVGALFLSVLLFYLFDFLDSSIYLMLLVGGGFSLLGKFLMERKT